MNKLYTLNRVINGMLVVSAAYPMYTIELMLSVNDYTYYSIEEV